MSPAPLIIVTMANERYAPGLGVMVCSALLWAEQKSVVFYVVDGGILPSTREGIVSNSERLAKSHGIDVTFRFLDFNKIELPSLVPLHGSMIPYALLFLPEVLSESSVFFVDADIVCNRPFPSPQEMETCYSSSLLAACKDPFFTSLEDDCPWKEQLTGEERRLTYVNSGFVWMNLVALREFRLWERFLELAATGMSMRYHDQTSINYLCRNRIHVLPQGFNNLFGKTDWRDMDIGCNFHFVGAWKPWMKDCGAKSFVAKTVFSSVARLFGFNDDVASLNHTTDMPASFLIGCYLKLRLYRLIGSRHAARQKHILEGCRWLKSSFPAYEARLSSRLSNLGQANISL